MRLTFITKAILTWTVFFGQYASAQYYRTQGKQILDPSGNPFLSKGVNLNGWLLPEAYGLRVDAVHDRHLNAESDIEENIVNLIGAEDASVFWQSFRRHWVTEQDIEILSSLGFNAIRLPFNYRLISPKETPGVYSEEGFQILDQVIEWCKTYNMALLLDMHACPGGQSHDAYADPEYSYWFFDEGGRNDWIQRGVQVMWEYNEDYFQQTGRTPEFNKQRTADIWRAIADRYKNEPTILGYELANEPYYYATSGVTDSDLRQFFIDVTAAVREVDSNHIVFVEGNIFAEMIDGLLPPFDDNMVIAFHRYWRETGYEDGKMQEYLDARDEHNVPFIMTESGENSNPWIYEITQLMNTNDIGWFFWGLKKVSGVAVNYEVEISDDYQYVIDNWRDSPNADTERIKRGLMDLTEASKTENCVFQPGYFAAMVDPLFNVKPQPYKYMSLPGTIHAVHYDIGNQGIAYSDTRYKNEEYQGEGWNLGWTYRNDGVDIQRSDASGEKSVGYHVFETEAGEWIKYTVDVTQAGTYKVCFRVSSLNGGGLKLRHDDRDLTSVVDVPRTNDGSWFDVTVDKTFFLPPGNQILTLSFVVGQIDVSWMDFELVEAGDTPRGSEDESVSEDESASEDESGDGSSATRIALSTIGVTLMALMGIFMV